VRPKTSPRAMPQSLPNIAAAQNDMRFGRPGGSLLICFAPPLCTAMSCRNLLRVVRFTVILFDLAARSTLCSWGLCTTVSAVVLDLPLPEIHSLSVPAPSGGHARGLALPLLVPAALSRSYSLTPIPTRYVNGSIYNLYYNTMVDYIFTGEVRLERGISDGDWPRVELWYRGWDSQERGVKGVGSKVTANV